MRHLTTAACLAAALGLYAVGLENGAALLFLAGGGFELLFWMRLYRPRKA